MRIMHLPVCSVCLENQVSGVDSDLCEDCVRATEEMLAERALYDNGLSGNSFMQEGTCTDEDEELRLHGHYRVDWLAWLDLKYDRDEVDFQYH